MSLSWLFISFSSFEHLHSSCSSAMPWLNSYFCVSFVFITLLAFLLFSWFDLNRNERVDVCVSVCAVRIRVPDSETLWLYWITTFRSTFTNFVTRGMAECFIVVIRRWSVSTIQPPRVRRARASERAYVYYYLFSRFVLLLAPAVFSLRSSPNRTKWFLKGVAL